MVMSWIAPDYPFTVRIVKGTSGNALNKQEYIFEAEPGSDSSTAVWRGRKLVYDSTGFQTQVLWADGDRKFDNVADDYATITFT